MRRRGFGFTLVEILIALAVLVIFTLGTFTLLSRFSKAGTIGQWRSTTNAQLRKAQERLRQGIESASYPMKITPQENLIADSPEHYIIVNPEGTGQPDDTTTDVARIFGPREATNDPIGAEDVVLKLIKSKPGREGLGNTASLADKEIEATLVQFVLRGSNRVYANEKIQYVRALFMVEDTKTMPTATLKKDTVFDFSGGKHSETLLVSDVNRIRVGVSKDAFKSGAATTTSTPAPVDMTLSCVEPSAGQSELVSNIRGQPNAGIDIK